MRRVLLVSASMGAGHDSVARELGLRLARRGCAVEQADWTTLGGERSGRAFKRFYAGLLARAPGVYDWAMGSWVRHPRFFENVTRIGAVAAERSLARLAREADLVVATYNLAGQALGRLRRAGKVTVPVATVVTDAGPHPYWWHAGVDLHVVPVEAAVVPGPWRWAAAAPVVRPEFAAVRGSGGGRVVLTGGAWGVGGVERVAALLAAERPVVMCGRDAGLVARLRAVEGVEPRGWTDDVAGVLRDARCLVDPAAGTSTWEALAAGVPVVVPAATLPGHGRINVDTLERLGAVTHARDDAALLAAVRTPRPSTLELPAADAADLLAELR